MPKRRYRIIIDTNLWISFLLSKNTRGLDQVFADSSLILLFSKELLDEFIEVTGRPKLKKYFNKVDLQNLLVQIDLHAEFINVSSNVELCRDPKDNFLISLALDGNANFLLTGDNDLLVLKKVGKTQIITITQFLELF